MGALSGQLSTGHGCQWGQEFRWVRKSSLFNSKFRLFTTGTKFKAPMLPLVISPALYFSVSQPASLHRNKEPLRDTLKTEKCPHFSLGKCLEHFLGAINIIMIICNGNTPWIRLWCTPLQSFILYFSSLCACRKTEQ